MWKCGKKCGKLSAVFKGTFEYRIDAKGRLPVPAPFRRLLVQDGHSAAVVATLLDQCLAVYTLSQWQGLEAQLLSMPPFAKQAKALIRRLASQASECSLDQQGRILIPPVLRRGAKLEKDVVVVGVLNRFEVWEPSAWATFLKDSEQILDDVTLPSSTAEV
jgi:MraZ protein